MSEADRALLERAAGAVSRETFDRLKELEALFRKWAAHINLVAPSTLDTLWERHIVDSSQLIRLAPAEKRWVDLGSGGGFPGLVIGVFLRDRPGAVINLVESNQKKAAFLRVATQALGLPARVHARRIEGVTAEIDSTEIVTARALAPLPVLLELSAPLLSAGVRGLFHKGRDYRREVQESSDLWSFDLVEHQSVVERDSVVLDISSLRRRQT